MHKDTRGKGGGMSVAVRGQRKEADGRGRGMAVAKGQFIKTYVEM